MPQLCRRLATVLAVILLAGLGGCASILRLEAPPVEVTAELPVLGITNARFWPDGAPEPLRREAAMMLQRQRARTSGALPPTLPRFVGRRRQRRLWRRRADGLDRHRRPPGIDIVTGISAGALIAPFAFLGPDYDPQLREVFTELAPRDVLLLRRIPLALLFGLSLADTSPLYRLIERQADERMLAAIAREYARGRLLLIGTTNLDLQRPVVWNIGAIAASGHPQALTLFRRILLASASIPGAFPPVLIDVEHAGQAHQEMHVDGGAATQVFLYPPALDARSLAGAAAASRRRTVWVIRNGRMDVEGANVNRGLVTIASRSIATLLHFSGVGDISRIYLTARRDGLDFRLSFIGSEFRTERREPFDQAYMRALFDYGAQKVLAGRAWVEEPPAVGTLAATADRTPGR
ncbi:patatin-like phospholipase family protein [Dankookia sp. P2]|uniref:patatin-like phospholipase family protein n=1 Tax=Dankookia sp. P2 TaxID=3423955 RepID=UPI003D668F39